METKILEKKVELYSVSVYIGKISSSDKSGINLVIYSDTTALVVFFIEELHEVVYQQNSLFTIHLNHSLIVFLYVIVILYILFLIKNQHSV